MKLTLRSMLILAVMTAVVMFHVVGCSVVDDLFSTTTEEVAVVDYRAQFEESVRALDESLPPVGGRGENVVKRRPACISEAVRFELPAAAIEWLAAACPTTSGTILVRRHDDLLVPANFWITEDNSTEQEHLLDGVRYFGLWTMAGLNSVVQDHTVCSGDLSRNLPFLQAVVIEAACRKYSLTTYTPPPALSSAEKNAERDADAERRAAKWRTKAIVRKGVVRGNGKFRPPMSIHMGVECPKLSNGNLASNCF